MIDLFFLGPEIISATNRLKATERRQTILWTYMDAKAAEHDIRTFVNQFPFISNRTKVMADKDAKHVTTHLKERCPAFVLADRLALLFE